MTSETILALLIHDKMVLILRTELEKFFQQDHIGSLFDKEPSKGKSLKKDAEALLTKLAMPPMEFAKELDSITKICERNITSSEFQKFLGLLIANFFDYSNRKFSPNRVGLFLLDIAKNLANKMDGQEFKTLIADFLYQKEIFGFAEIIYTETKNSKKLREIYFKKHPPEYFIDHQIDQIYGDLTTINFMKSFQERFAKYNFKKEISIGKGGNITDSVRSAYELTKGNTPYDLGIVIATGALQTAFIFEKMGLPIKIIESHARHGESTIKNHDNLQSKELENKKILVIEDDFFTKAWYF